MSRGQRRQALQEDVARRLQHHQDTALFVQEVLCWRRPLHAAVLAVTLHGAWYWLCFTKLRPIAALASVLLACLALDALLRIAGAFGLLPDKCPTPLKPEYDHSKPTRLRTMPELCDSLSFARLCLSDFGALFRRLYHTSPGQFAALICFWCLAASQLASLFPGPVVAYMLVLCVIVGPALERVPIVRKKGAKYASTAVAVAAVALRLSEKVIKTVRISDSLPTPAELSEQKEKEARELERAFRAHHRRSRQEASYFYEEGEEFIYREEGDVQVREARGWSILHEESLNEARPKGVAAVTSTPRVGGQPRLPDSPSLEEFQVINESEYKAS